jgi:hypothetical protein
MGSPIAPDKPAYDTLRAAGQLGRLAHAETTVKREGASVKLSFVLPRQGVSLLLVPLPQH